MTFKSIILGLTLLNFSSYIGAKNTAEESIWWGVSAGQINIFRETELKNNLYGLELRFKSVTKWNLVPSVGYKWGDSGFNYLYSDLRYPFEIGENWLLNINSGIGVYDESNVFDLGHEIEFRSGFEIIYKLDERQRLGFSANHYSNSRLADRNPGTESVSLIYLHMF